MRIKALTIRNFKSIKSLTLKNIEETLILVGQNNVGKSAIIDAIKIVASTYEPTVFDYRGDGAPIQVELTLHLDEDDLFALYEEKRVSLAEDFDGWLAVFHEKIPTYKEEAILIFCEVTGNGIKTYSDGLNRVNDLLPELFPKLYIIDESRKISQLHDALIYFENGDDIEQVKEDDDYDQMEVILAKPAGELSLYETLKLVKYRFYQENLVKYTEMVNEFFKLNYGKNHVIEYNYQFDTRAMLEMKTVARNLDNGHAIDIYDASNSMKSLYILSLFQAYIALEERSMNIFIIEQPELHLHPELQKVTSEILYKLSKKNQVIFTTHSPNMIQNYSETQIRQVGLNKNHQTIIKGPTDVDRILADLGQTASDLMNVNFVFIVEGKDDRSKLPYLLDKYYGETRNKDGSLNRIAVIPTNSCTNIRTYANLKFINKTFLKDNFLIIRDSDGKNREELVGQLTDYYDQRRKYDDAKIPRVKPENVLVLKYYAIENYFLEPEILKAMGVIKSVESFYEILYSKYTQYLYRLRSTKHMKRQTGLWFDGPEDMKAHFETIKIYVRGHNLFDIFYGRYSRKEQLSLMKQYIDLAPREVFADILDPIEGFVFFINRRRKETDNG